MKLDGLIADARKDLDSIVHGIRIADRLNIPFWYIREQKKHGTRKIIEGDEKMLYQMINDKKNIYVLKRYGEKNVKN